VGGEGETWDGRVVVYVSSGVEETGELQSVTVGAGVGMGGWEGGWGYGGEDIGIGACRTT